MLMNTWASILFLGALIAAHANVQDSFSPHIGWGAHKLKNFQGKGGLLSGNLKATNCENVTQYNYHDAVIDNFAPIDKQQKWYSPQRYWMNRQFWGGPGYPVFVFIGGEGEESCSRLTSRMYVFELAEQHRALMVDVEHRFYGKSIPTQDSSTENLQYLSSTQALADLARVIGYVKKSLHTEESPVITVGGSYPGNLAAWFRLKYPSVTQGSIASSAPVLAQTNFPEYMDVVGQSIIHFSGQKCFNAFELAANIIESFALQGVNGSSGIQHLQEDFQTCSPIRSNLDLAVFLSDLMGNVQGTVQYNNEHNGVLNVTDICKIMTQSDDAYGNFVSLQKLYREANGQTCEDASWSEMVASLKTTSASRSWTFQTCNEFGYYQTTDSINQPFHAWKWLNLEFSRQICYAIFNGWKADPEVNWINDNYGNLNIAGTNIVLPSGTIDPWHALAVSNTTKPLPQSSETKVFIEGTAHCNDLYAPAPSDPPSLTYAREEIANHVTQWLREYSAF